MRWDSSAEALLAPLSSVSDRLFLHDITEAPRHRRGKTANNVWARLRGMRGAVEIINI